MDELIEGFDDGAIEFVESADAGFCKLLIILKRVENATGEWSVEALEELEVDDAEAISLSRQSIATRMRDFLDQLFGSKFGQVVRERAELIVGEAPTQGF